MRAKTLLLTAALSAAGMISAFAADNVYSINVVGYVNKPLTPGFNLVCNPLDTPPNTADKVLTGLPDSTMVYKLRAGGAGYDIYTFIVTETGESGWDPEPPSLPLGVGFYIYNPTAGTLNVTWVGEVKQGPTTNTVTAGFTMQGSQVPQQADVETLGLRPLDSDMVYRLKAGGNGFDIYTYIVTETGERGWDPEAPTIGVGEAYLLYSATGGTKLDRDFKVN